MVTDPVWQFRPDYATVDHVEPWSRLKTRRQRRNALVVMACLRCNLLKGDRPLITFLLALNRL